MLSLSDKRAIINSLSIDFDGEYGIGYCMYKGNFLTFTINIFSEDISFITMLDISQEEDFDGLSKFILEETKRRFYEEPFDY